MYSSVLTSEGLREVGREPLAEGDSLGRGGRDGVPAGDHPAECLAEGDGRPVFSGVLPLCINGSSTSFLLVGVP